MTGMEKMETEQTEKVAGTARKPLEENRVALMGIILEDTEAASRVNGLLHEYGSYIIGRMGLPYREKGMHIISVVLDAPQSTVSALSGKLGMIPGVSSKCLYRREN